jgi:hypothetical protein
MALLRCLCHQASLFRFDGSRKNKGSAGKGIPFRFKSLRGPKEGEESDSAQKASARETRSDPQGKPCFLLWHAQRAETCLFF